MDKRRGDEGAKGGDLRDRLGRRSGGGSAREDRRGGDRRNSFDDLLNTAMGKKLPPRDRSRSPIRAKKSSRIDYDDPDNSVKEDTAARRQGGKEEQEVAGHLLQSLNGVSPLQGSKVVVTNLAVSVTQVNKAPSHTFQFTPSVPRLDNNNNNVSGRRPGAVHGHGTAQEGQV